MYWIFVEFFKLLDYKMDANIIFRIVKNYLKSIKVSQPYLNLVFQINCKLFLASFKSFPL